MVKRMMSMTNPEKHDTVQPFARAVVEIAL